MPVPDCQFKLPFALRVQVGVQSVLEVLVHRVSQIVHISTILKLHKNGNHFIFITMGTLMCFIHYVYIC